MTALPCCRAETEEQEAFETLTLQLTALATMAGLPQVSLQVPACSHPRPALSQQKMMHAFMRSISPYSLTFLLRHPCIPSVWLNPVCSHCCTFES